MVSDSVMLLAVMCRGKDDEINTYYEANKEGFRVEEKVSVDYIELSVDTIKDQIQVSEEQITQFYEENIKKMFLMFL